MIWGRGFCSQLQQTEWELRNLNKQWKEKEKPCVCCNVCKTCWNSNKIWFIWEKGRFKKKNNRRTPLKIIHGSGFQFLCHTLFIRLLTWSGSEKVPFQWQRIWRNKYRFKFKNNNNDLNFKLIFNKWRKPVLGSGFRPLLLDVCIQIKTWFCANIPRTHAIKRAISLMMFPLRLTESFSLLLSSDLHLPPSSLLPACPSQLT